MVISYKTYLVRQSTLKNNTSLVLVFVEVINLKLI